jgi:hypothetical protein
MSKDQTPKTRRGLDPEIQAMARLDRIMSELDAQEAHRALEWLRGRYSFAPVNPIPKEEIKVRDIL